MKMIRIASLVYFSFFADFVHALPSEPVSIPLSSNASGSGRCGVATNMLDFNDQAMTTFCDNRLDFWWNWGTEPRNPYTAGCAKTSFVSMIWGYGSDNAANAAKAGAFSALMGYNEPDHWAPPAYPGGDYLSSGSFPQTFQCSQTMLAQNWQQVVMAYKNANPTGQILSPAMADAGNNGMGTASTGAYIPCDASPQTAASHMDDCVGWLQGFKAAALKQQCGPTNCWDAIDVLQLHAYFYQAADLIAKVKLWEAVWAEDLQGTNGRSVKSLMITEFAHAGTTDPSDPDGSARQFMQECVTYFKASPYITGWSWFSETNTSFASFTINGQAPIAKFWDSSLFEATGNLTVIGEKYTELCS